MKKLSAVVLFLIVLVIPWGAPSLAQDESPTDAPTNLVASGAFTGVSVRSVILTWQDNSDTDAGFVIEASATGGNLGNTWTPIAYTPNDYITLHSALGYSTLGYYSGLTAGSTRYFRVRAKHTGEGPSLWYSNVVQVVMPPSPTCATPKQVSPVPNFLAHAEFPIDLVIATNISASCLGGIDHKFCLISGPPGLVVDFNSGTVLWTPSSSVPASNPVSIGFIAEGSACTAAAAVATTNFTINVDDNTMVQPLPRDYRSEDSEIKIAGRAYQNMASWAIHSSELCPTYDGVSCPLTEEVPPSTEIIGPTTQGFENWNLLPYPDGSRRLLSLIVQSPTKQNSAVYNPVIIDRTSFNANWPKRLPIGSVRGALAVDLTNDGRDEIIANSRDGVQGGPYVWDVGGAVNWQAPGGGLTESEVAVGDVDGDGENDVVTVSKYKLRVFRGGHGTLMGTIQIADPITFTNGGASLADIDGDRDLEILVNTNGSGATPAKTYIYKWNGGLVPYSADWPKSMAYSSPSARPSTADLDGDGHLDVIVDDHQYVYAWSTDPSHPLAWPNSRVSIPAPLYPLAFKVNGGTNPNGFAQPAIADLDENGTPDIIVVGQNVISPAGTYLRCLNGGVCTAASTKITAAVGMSAAIGEFVHTSPGPEILLGGYVFSSDPAASGPPILTLGGGTTRGLSTIVDGGLGDDFELQTYALMGSAGATQFTANISAFEADGSIDEDYPKALYGDTRCGSAPQLGDFDGDGSKEVLVEITDSTYGAVVALYHADEWLYTANNPWPMAGHDPQRTGRYNCKQQRQACTTDSQCCSARCNSGTCQ